MSDYTEKNSNLIPQIDIPCFAWNSQAEQGFLFFKAKSLEYWLFTDDNVFNKIGKELHSISVAEWLYGKCEDNDLSTTFMNTQYDWSDYNMDAAADVDVSKCCNNQWDQVMINYVRNVVEESISYKLEESLREMVNYKFEMDYIKDAIKNVLDLEDKQ